MNQHIHNLIEQAARIAIELECHPVRVSAILAIIQDEALEAGLVDNQFKKLVDEKVQNIANRSYAS